MANQEMERALIFAGYEVNHVWGDGRPQRRARHRDLPRRHALALEGLARAGQGRARARRSSRRSCIPGEGWQLVGEGYKFTEGPAANAKGEVFFNDIPNSKTYKIGLDGKVSLFLADTKKANGQAFGPDGRLYAVAAGAEQILAYDADGKPTVIAEGFRGNDLVVRHDGGIYVTNPGWNGTEPEQGLVHQPARARRRSSTPGSSSPTASRSRPTSRCSTSPTCRSHWVYSYQIQPDGSLAYKQKYYHLHVPDTADDSGADGMRVDRDGRLYVATRMGIQVCDQAGRVNCIIPTPNGKVANLCFGGADFDTLFATCGDRVYKRKVKVKGRCRSRRRSSRRRRVCEDQPPPPNSAGAEGSPNCSSSCSVAHSFSTPLGSA